MCLFFTMSVQLDTNELPTEAKMCVAFLPTDQEKQKTPNQPTFRSVGTKEEELLFKFCENENWCIDWQLTAQCWSETHYNQPASVLKHSAVQLHQCHWTRHKDSLWKDAGMCTAEMLWKQPGILLKSLISDQICQCFTSARA